MIMVRQLALAGAVSSNLIVHDFLISKKDFDSDPWLNNKHGNGWHWDVKDNRYTPFILRIIR